MKQIVILDAVIRSCGILVIATLSAITQAHDPQFNNGSAEDYRRAASLSGDVRAIQAATLGLWPRMSTGTEYTVAPNTVTFTDSENYLTIQTNNLPDHILTTTNPNCATSQRYTFKIPKTPQVLDRPRAITKEMQEIGIALNGVVIAGPFDSENKIAPYHRVVDQCVSHADPQGMYHYHFSPLCMKDSDGQDIALREDAQVGWSFDGYKIFGLADRTEHLPTIDACNGHAHGDDYHYHATRDFPFFMGCYMAKPHAQNFQQKSHQGSGTCPSSIPRVGQGSGLGGPGMGPKPGGPGGRPNFVKATQVLGLSESVIKRALGPPPGNFRQAAQTLGISEQVLRDALDKPN